MSSFRARPTVIAVMGAVASGLCTPGAAPAQGGDLEDRVARIERVLGSQGMLDLANQIDRLQQEVKRLRGEIERQGHDLEQIDKRQRALGVDVDRRSAAIEGPRGIVTPPATEATAGASSPSTPTAPPTGETATGETVRPPGVAAPTVKGSAAGPSTQAREATSGAVTTTSTPGTNPPPGVATASPATEQEAYQQAFSQLKMGRYELSIAGFHDFLAQYPNSSYADSAQYWLGEAYYVTHQFEPAIAEYNKLVQNHPQSQRLTQALLKIGYSYHELGQSDQAIASLEDLRTRYPGTTAARLAEERLQRIKLEQQ